MATPDVRASSPVRERQRWSLVAGGVLLIVVFSVLGALLWGSRAAEVEVFIASRNITAGQEIRPEDVSRIMIPAETNVARLERDSTDLQGSIALTDVGAGTLLNSSLIATTDDNPDVVATTIQVGMSLTSDEAPASLEVGDTVRVVEIPSARAQQSELEIPEATHHEGIIADVRESVGGQLWVSVLVDAEVADRITSLSALGSIALAEVG